MAFEKGKRLPRQGGRENGLKGGRPSKEKAEAKAMAKEMVVDWLQRHLRPVLDTYLALATGARVGNIRRKLDPATCRHFIERFVPPATKTININEDLSCEAFYKEFWEAEEKERQEKLAQAQNQIEPPKTKDGNTLQ